MLETGCQPVLKIQAASFLLTSTYQEQPPQQDGSWPYGQIEKQSPHLQDTHIHCFKNAHLCNQKLSAMISLLAANCSPVSIP